MLTAQLLYKKKTKKQPKYSRRHLKMQRLRCVLDVSDRPFCSWLKLERGAALTLSYLTVEVICV